MVNYLGTKSGKVLVNSAFSIGAAIVILGALGKINHTSWGGLALTVGMMTEFFIFLMMTFIPVEEHNYWERYFPDIMKDPEQEKGKDKNLPVQKINFMTGGGGGTANPALDKLDTMLQQANISPTNLEKLANNFEKLNKSVSKMGDVSLTLSNLSDFTNKTQETNVALDQLKTAYITTAHKVTDEKMGVEINKYVDELQKLTKNIGSLNKIYSADNKGNAFVSMQTYLSNLDQYIKEMENTAQHVEEINKQTNTLSINLTNLNAVYGRMLTAMQFK